MSNSSVSNPLRSGASAFITAISNKTAKVGVIGLGYVGLPLVELFARNGFHVKGFDIDTTKVDALNSGQSYIGHIGSERVASMIASGRFEATSDFARLGEVDAIIICVPTPLGRHREPDLGPVINTGKMIGKYLEKGQLVILESTHAKALEFVTLEQLQEYALQTEK